MAFTHIGKVSDVFELGRGVVVVIDQPIAQLAIPVRVHDPVELRTAAGVVLRTHVSGVEHADPWTTKRLFAFLLPQGVGRNDVPPGAEVWVGNEDPVAE